MEITKIDKCKKARNRYNIFIDGKFAFSLSDELLLEKNFHKGQVLCSADVDATVKEDQKKRAVEKAFRFLSYRDRSEKEIRDKLLEKFTEDVVDAAIARLKELGYVDDRSFARKWVEARKSQRGKKVISSELFKLGVDKDISEEATKELGLEEVSIAREIINKKKNLNSLTDIKEIYSKLGGFLTRRGFSYDTVKILIEEQKKKSL